ncbi:PAS domain-containing protein [Bradyrhizobium sp. RDT46]|uniref:PAS domain-containing protein n=1 Tax=Bradyrhizobium sp. RDT46 TaxID=3341829 RepID=UPI0035C769D6
MHEVGDQPVGGERQRRAPLIVGVGASPGSLGSIARFFAKLTVGTDLTVVLTLGHHEALDEVREAVRKANGGKVVEITDGHAVDGGTIYLCPPAMITTIRNGRFAVRKAEQSPGERAIIDSLLVSLAEERAEQSVGILLAGTGGDGTLGIATLKDHGGLAITEGVASPEQAAHLVDGNAPASIADFVLPPEEIPAYIQVYARHLRCLERKSSNARFDSLNKELQSVNGELETSREELQSVTAELTMVSGELAHRVQELTRTSSDLKNLIESTQIATLFLDNDLRVMNFTPAITQVLHLVETDTGRPIAQIKAHVPIEELYDDIRRVLRTLESVERELSATDSGTRYVVRILPYRSIDNLIAGVVITFVDVTAVIRAEERQRLLLAELQHRVRNTLGVVRSIARRSAETSSTVEEYASHLDGRLNAFARTQALVTRDPEGGVDLEFLVVEELLAYNAREGEQMRVAGPRVRFQAKAAETFALAIHELATNALKYGALSRPDGRVEITWRLEKGRDPAMFLFRWRERGGPPVKPPPRKGFGTELLERTLAFELKGDTALAFDPAGLECSIAIPLSKRMFHTPVVDG